MQTKVRGFRVDLQEIEQLALQEPLVTAAAAVVVHRQSPSASIRLFIASHDTNAAQTVNTALRASLPSYMVPSAVKVLGVLPLTTSGKIDRQHLTQIAEAGSLAELR
jgi:acyl-CoA synthetase (AMP-forming)/AMP-acid ligase II